MKHISEYLPIQDEANYYHCQCLDTASMLVAMGYELASLDRQGQRKVVFLFKKLKGLEDDVDNFLAGKLSVNALAFTNARKNLKSRIYALKTIDY